MKNCNPHTNNHPNEGRGRFRREWAVALFCLLMATALPALAAMAAGFSASARGDRLTEETVFLLCRHGNDEGMAEEELSLGRLLALSLAATNPSDTPAASLEAQAILLRSRAVWWMDYCHIGEEDAEADEEKTARRQANGGEDRENGAVVEENGSKTKNMEENNTSRKESAENGVETKKTEENDTAMKQNTQNGAALPILCDSPVHGLPYLSQDELNSCFGEQETMERLKAAEKAVEVTRGQVLCYEGEVVPALLHHSSGGVTRSVENLPWLASVPTPEEGEEAVCRLSAEEARAALAARFGLLLPADPALWELTPETGEDGRVETVEVAGVELSGTAFAEALSLPSATFALTVEADALTFTCAGEGSGCGLSRAGAAIYAAGGLNCGEILAHYYPDCTVGVMGG